MLCYGMVWYGMVCMYVCAYAHVYIYSYNIHREIQCRMFRIWNHPFRGITRWHSLRSITIFCGVRLGQLLYLFSGQRFNDQINLKMLQHMICAGLWPSTSATRHKSCHITLQSLQKSQRVRRTCRPYHFQRFRGLRWLRSASSAQLQAIATVLAQLAWDVLVQPKLLQWAHKMYR